MLNLLKQMYRQFSNTEKNIADYLLDNHIYIPNYSIHEIAQQIGVSSSTISRFVRKWFDISYREFTLEIVKENEAKSLQKTNEIFQWADNFEEMPMKVITGIEITCRDVLANNDIQFLDKMIELIYEANIVYLFGVGSSGIVALDLQQKLIKLGIKTFYISDSNFAVIASTLITDKDVCIAITFSGQTRDVNFALQQTSLQNATIICITSTLTSFLRKTCDYLLHVPSSETYGLRLAPIFSRYGQLFLVDILFVGLAKKLANSPTDLIDKYQDLLDKMKGT